jgi:hypothetical protein
MALVDCDGGNCTRERTGADNANLHVDLLHQCATGSWLDAASRGGWRQRSGGPEDTVIIKITLTIYAPPFRFSGAMSAPLTPISAPS